MKVTMLAAGLGQRLEQENPPPKVLLSFEGRSLLQRHLEIFENQGVNEIHLVLGYRRDLVEAELDSLDARGRVTTWFNPDFRQGALVSLWTLREVFRAGEPLLFMDGDVLYHPEMISRLIHSPLENCFLMDRATAEGEDPVKLCHKDGLLVDFHKRPQLAFDWWGEWIGFAKFSAPVAAAIADAADRRVLQGASVAIYEDAMRDVLLASPPGTFGIEDVTGIPWVEIDFPEDLARAEKEILPAIKGYKQKAPS